ncbi:MAG: tetratricopeptide (TPR) repeat protein [Pirellulaceae bacterium]|jgi:tetratricopeptide (TPR) repeat protein
MKKWFVLAWLLIPIALLSYHFGPGQDALAFRQAQAHLTTARKLEAAGHYEEAIEAYAEALVTLPAADEPSAQLQSTKLAAARDQLRLAQIRGHFQLGRLAETIDSLNILIADVESEHGPQSPLAYDVRDFLGRVHFQAMVALRLEAAEKDVWRRHWELSRQNFRFLAEHTDGNRNHLDRQNLEVVIKSFNSPVPPSAAASAAGSATAGLNTVLSPLTTPPSGAGSGGPPPPPDARPRPPTADLPDPVANELDLGS